VQLTITCQDEELFLAIDSVRDDLGVGGDDLGLGFQRKVLLELEIPKRTGEGEVTVDAAELDESTRRGYTRSLLWTASVRTPETNGARVTRVGLGKSAGHEAEVWAVRTTIRRPSVVSKPTTAVQPDGSLKKFGSEVTGQPSPGQTPREDCGPASPARRASSVFKNTSFSATSYSPASTRRQRRVLFGDRQTQTHYTNLGRSNASGSSCQQTWRPNYLRVRQTPPPGRYPPPRHYRS
jgi:hypothetical protein